jgi:hypothetical protein
MIDPVITLTTDFGAGSPYEAALKGVIVALNPRARLIDLSHAIPAQDVWHGAFFLASAIPYFPADAIHVVVVDPGVGTERRLLCCDLGRHRLVAPDNGILSLLAQEHPVDQAVQLTNPRYWLPVVSPTFHGRDILAPVAAHLSLGVDPLDLGPPVDDLVQLPVPQPQVNEKAMEGEVIFVDSFGNMVSNIPARGLATKLPQVFVNGQIPARWVRTYREAKRGELVALASSTNLLEIAVVMGSAAEQLGRGRGTSISVRF